MYPSFIKGNKGNIINVNNYKLGLGVCYDSLFTNLFRKQAKKGANLLISISSTSSFGDNNYVPLRDMNTNKIRAIENGRYLIRVDNYGPSGIIDPFGNIITEIKNDVRSAKIGNYKLISKKTFYVKYGNWFIYFFNDNSINFYYKKLKIN